MPTLHLLCGLPGAGKTTYAQKLERQVRAVRFTPDEWITRLLGAEPERAALDAARTPVETLQWEMGQRLLTLGIDVILDFGFWSREEREAFREVAAELGAQSVVHFVDAPLEVLEARRVVRNRDRPANTFQITAAQLEEWSATFERPASDELLPREHMT